MVGVETQTHTAGPPQTRTSWCARTGRWGWAAAPRSRSWCSGWRSSSERGTAWTSPVSASPTASPGPLQRSQRMSGARLWQAPRPTSSPFWERGGDTGADVHGTKLSAWWIAVQTQTAMCAHLVSREWVRMSRQLTIIAESLPGRETFAVDVDGDWNQRGRRAYTERGAKQTLPKREILCLTRAASLQNRLGKKDGEKRINKKASERTKTRGNKQSKQGNKKKSEGKYERQILHSSLS